MAVSAVRRESCGDRRPDAYNERMTIASTIYHIQQRSDADIEAALDGLFAREERPQALRVEGSYSAVLARVNDPTFDAALRYLLLRPHGDGKWTPLLELGSGVDELDVELSKALAGATIVTVYQFGEVVSGYRVVRAGAEVDRYMSDPTAFLGVDERDDGNGAGSAAPDVEEERGHPARFADLLPAGTAPEEFTRVVLSPGWWERHDAGATAAQFAESDEEEEMVDEIDRMRCIAIALELWAPDAYPLTEDLEDLSNKAIGPAIALAWN